MLHLHRIGPMILVAMFHLGSHVVGAQAASTSSQQDGRVGGSVPLRGADVALRHVRIVAMSDSTTLASVAFARRLPSGGVIANDDRSRQLVVFDEALSHASVVADSTGVAPRTRYGMRGYPGGLLPYLADSSLFVDPEAGGFVVMDPTGRFSRSMAAVKPADLKYVWLGMYGMASVDPRGRLIYRSLRSRTRAVAFPEPDKPLIDISPDSAPLLRADFDTRRIDTIGMLRVQPDRYEARVLPKGGVAFTTIINPLPFSDQWTVIPDGTVAIVRAQTYSVDWLDTDGSLRRGSRIPTLWKRLSSEDKQQLIDSLRQAQAAREAAQPPRATGQPPEVVFVEPAELPDYYPPVRAGQVFADPEANIWILPTFSAPSDAGLIYDVVNRRGELVERVALPKGRALVGFGRAGELYLARTTSARRTQLERAVIQAASMR